MLYEELARAENPAGKRSKGGDTETLGGASWQMVAQCFYHFLQPIKVKLGGASAHYYLISL